MVQFFKLYVCLPYDTFQQRFFAPSVISRSIRILDRSGGHSAVACCNSVSFYQACLCCLVTPIAAPPLIQRRFVSNTLLAFKRISRLIPLHNLQIRILGPYLVVKSFLLSLCYLLYFSKKKEKNENYIYTSTQISRIPSFPETKDFWWKTLTRKHHLKI